MPLALEEDLEQTCGSAEPPATTADKTGKGDTATTTSGDAVDDAKGMSGDGDTVKLEAAPEGKRKTNDGLKGRAGGEPGSEPGNDDYSPAADGDENAAAGNNDQRTKDATERESGGDEAGGEMGEVDTRNTETAADSGDDDDVDDKRDVADGNDSDQRDGDATVDSGKTSDRRISCSKRQQ